MNPILSVTDLNISFLQDGVEFGAVNNISFQVNKGETVALVGESGSGKSVTALSTAALLGKSASVNGKITIDGNSVASNDESALQKLRGNQVSFIFQEPMTSLNPLHTIEQQLSETVSLHQNLNKERLRENCISLLEKVGITDIKLRLNAYPHQLSGGQRQRIMIAMAIANRPKILIADEPTTALDVTVQKEIIELLLEIKRTEGLSIIFISHDLALVSEIADRLIVMFKGKIIEKGKAAKIFSNPIENYTKGLLYSRPNNKVKLSKLPTVSDYINNSVNNTIVNDKEIEISRQKIYSNSPILEIKNLDKYYIQNKVWFKKKEVFKALDGINLKLFKGETLGLVGESGCGKSTLVKTIVQIEKASNGSIFYKGVDITKLSKSELNHYRKDINKAVVHCFTGTQKELDEYLNYDFYIGLTGWICDERRNKDLRASIKNIPLNKLMLETDSPYLIPRNLDPKPKSNRNEPKNLLHIATEIAKLRNESVDEICNATYQNSINFFSQA